MTNTIQQPPSYISSLFSNNKQASYEGVVTSIFQAGAKAIFIDGLACVTMNAFLYAAGKKAIIPVIIPTAAAFGSYIIRGVAREFSDAPFIHSTADIVGGGMKAILSGINPDLGAFKSLFLGSFNAFLYGATTMSKIDATKDGLVASTAVIEGVDAGLKSYFKDENDPTLSGMNGGLVGGVIGLEINAVYVEKIYDATNKIAKEFVQETIPYYNIVKAEVNNILPDFVVNFIGDAHTQEL